MDEMDEMEEDNQIYYRNQEDQTGMELQGIHVLSVLG